LRFFNEKKIAAKYPTLAGTPTEKAGRPKILFLEFKPKN